MWSVVALFLLSSAQSRGPEVAAPAEPPCPIAGFDRRAGDACLVEVGPNWTFTFASPRQAAGIPALAAHLDERRRLAREGEVQWLADYARDHQEGDYFHEHSYRLDADLPELLALSAYVSEYSGGAHGWDSHGIIIWDRAANRRIGFEELFAAPTAARAEMRRLLCPVLGELTIQRLGGGWPCPEPPYSAALATGRSGRIETLRLALGEVHGRAGGHWEVQIPVTQAIVAAVRAPLQGAFNVSATAPRACNNEHCIEDRQRQ